jgi:cyclic beta-1,2-glucan synthetase
MMSPIAHGSDADNLSLYKVEPYVVAADIYALAGQEGRGGWTWYTGSAAWMYRVWIEEVLGFKKRGDTLEIVPQVPNTWRKFRISYRYKSAIYEIGVFNIPGKGLRHVSVKLDGDRIDGSVIHLVDDGKVHAVRIDCYHERHTASEPPDMILAGGG